MPALRRPTPRRPAASEVASPIAEATNGLPGLQFNEPLTSRPGKPIPVAELLRRLQALFAEMRPMEQEEIDRDSFTAIAQELASPSLLGHKEKGVRAWTANCLVEILKLCAPDAPYSVAQLKDIFSLLIVSILPALSDPSNAYNSQHMYVLQSLARVRSIILIIDLPHIENLIIRMFANCFDVVSGSSKYAEEAISKSVVLNMTAILIVMVDEMETVPQEAVDTIIAQFLRVDPGVVGAGVKGGPAVDEKQSTLALKELPPAYHMARTICNTSPEKMSREISKYFNEVILDASTSGSRRDSLDLDPDESLLGSSESDVKELNKIHKLVRELWRACHSVLPNIIPQLEAELSAENVGLRLLATEALADMISGIGAAGPPMATKIDPSRYPPFRLADAVNPEPVFDPLTTPSSPQPFSQVYPHVYSNFLSRRQDKSSIIRAGWSTGIGRILSTSAGGTGLSVEEQTRLTEDLARMLNDSDEKVRLAAIKAIGTFSFPDVIHKLGISGAVDTPGSVLANLAERVKDRKSAVRSEGMKVLARMWAASTGELRAGNAKVIDLLGGIPSKIFNAFYANDLETNALLDEVLFTILVPLSYPLKAKSKKPVSGHSADQDDGDNIDADKIRAERILLLAQRLDEKARKVFFAISKRQFLLSKFISAYLEHCESYNGGVMDKNADKITSTLDRLIGELSKLFPESEKCSSDLWKFAKLHDRRNYQLIRFCMAPASDFRTMFKAHKELIKRLQSHSSSMSLQDSLISLLYRSSITIYNKSHVSAIMEFSRNESGLAPIALDILKDISAQTPDILKAHVQEICQTLQDEAPTASKLNDPAVVDSLKACAVFAKKFPADIPQDRKFHQALVAFALFGRPAKTAKHAVSILLASSDTREQRATDLLHKCLQFRYDGPGFMARLAATSQLSYLAPAEVAVYEEVIDERIIRDLLLTNRHPTSTASEYSWHLEPSSALAIETEAKCWAIRVAVNRARSSDSDDIYTLLVKLINLEGELGEPAFTPGTVRPRLRLLAARSILKLCLLKAHEARLNPIMFNKLAEIAQDSVYEVRVSFLARLKKYLSYNRLTPRFYTIPFLLAFEPEFKFKVETATWLRSRAAYFRALQSAMTEKGSSSPPRSQTALEAVMARLLSLLAHHPDYSVDTDDLLESASYIVYYLGIVANEANISLIYYIAQRVKGCRDAVQPDASPEDTDIMSTRLYILSDLAQLIIHALIEAQSWALESLPTLTRLTLPRSLFTVIRDVDHDAAMAIAEKSFLSEETKADLLKGIETQLKHAFRKDHREKEVTTRKRKSEAADPKAKKRSRHREGVHKPQRDGKKIKTKGKRGSDWGDSDDEAVEELAVAGKDSERRKSGRGIRGTNYVEREDEEDDEEMHAGAMVAGPNGDHDDFEAEQSGKKTRDQNVNLSSPSTRASKSQSRNAKTLLESQPTSPPIDDSSPTSRKKPKARSLSKSSISKDQTPETPKTNGRTTRLRGSR